MTGNEYQDKAVQTAIYNETYSIIYPILGLSEEAGEVAGKLAKAIRDNDGKVTEEHREQLLKELGDCLWFVSAALRDLGYTMEEAMEANIAKLRSRQERDVLKGSGDER